MRRFAISRATMLTALSLLLISGALAQSGSLALLRWRIAGGGVASRGGEFTLTGTIGQPDAGRTEGGGYALSGGFWGGSLVQRARPIRQLHLPMSKKPGKLTQCGDLAANDDPDIVTQPLQAINDWCVGVLEATAKDKTRSLDYYLLDLPSGTVVFALELSSSYAGLAAGLFEKRGLGIYVPITSQLPYTLKPGFTYFARAQSSGVVAAPVEYRFRVGKQ